MNQVSGKKFTTVHNSVRKIHKKLHVFVQVNFHFFFFTITWSKLMAFSWLLAYEEYSLRNGAKYLKASPIVVCSMYSNRVLFTSMICSMLLKMLLWTSSGIRQLNRKGKSKCWKIQTPYYTSITFYNHSKLLQKRMNNLKIQSTNCKCKMSSLISVTNQLSIITSTTHRKSLDFFQSSASFSVHNSLLY